MAAIPRVVHFVFGLAPQVEPFHLAQYVAIESCRQVLEPDEILLHYEHLPYGVYWDLVRPHLTLVRVDAIPEVLNADYSEGLVPEKYRYAHHADFVRLDALIEHGGVYADMDTVFLRRWPDEWHDRSFVIGSEGLVPDPRTGEERRSLCNALMLSAPGAPFARAWRERIGDALDGSWSNHSGFLAQALADAHPEMVQVEPPSSFFPAPCTVAGLRSLLQEDSLDTSAAYSAHLWSHLWWEADRRDSSGFHGGMLTASYVRDVDTTLNRLLRPHVPELDLW